MFVCMCNSVTEAQIRSCVRAGARTVEEVGERSGAGTGCGGCLETVELLVEGGGLLYPAPRHDGAYPTAREPVSAGSVVRRFP